MYRVCVELEDGRIYTFEKKTLPYDLSLTQVSRILDPGIPPSGTVRAIEISKGVEDDTTATPKDV